MIIDYHAHLPYDRATNQFDEISLMNDMELNGIDMRLVSALYGPSIQTQNDKVAELAQSHPKKILACAVINPKAYDCLIELDRIIAMGCFKAIELDPMEHNYFPEECEALDEVIIKASQASLTINVYTGWGCRTMPFQWEKYALRHPQAKFVMLHMGTTDFGYGTVNYLAPRTPNLYLETSCMYELQILKKAFIKVDHGKFLFGSHYPHKITKCSIDAFELLCLDEKTRAKLFHENAQNLINKTWGTV